MKKNKDKLIEELDLRYRMALMLLVTFTNKDIKYYTNLIDKHIGHKYEGMEGESNE